MLARMYRKGNPCILLVELYIKAAITENSMEPGYSGVSVSLALRCVEAMLVSFLITMMKIPDKAI